MENKYDLLGFIAPQMQPPVPHPYIKDKDLCISATACPPSIFFKGMNNRDMTMAMCSKVQEFRKTLEDNGATIVLSRSDLKKPGLKVILNLQDPPPIPEAMKDLFDDGIRISQIAYQGENNYGGGFLAHKTDVTDKAAYLILEMKRTGMILDLAHASDNTAFQVSLMSFVTQLPIFISHTGAYGLMPNKRNASDFIIRSVMNQAGIVGVFNLTFCLDKLDNGVQPFVNHIQYMRNLHPQADQLLAYGSDWWYCDADYEKCKETSDMIRAKVDPDGALGSRFPDQIFDLAGPNRMDKTETALRIAFGAPFTRKFLSENAEAFLVQALPA